MAKKLFIDKHDLELETRYLEIKGENGPIEKIVAIVAQIGEVEASKNLNLTVDVVREAIEFNRENTDEMLRIDKQRRTNLQAHFEKIRIGLKTLGEKALPTFGEKDLEDKKEYCTLRSESPTPIPPSCPICAALEKQSTKVERLGNTSYIIQHEHKELPENRST